jgi:hypothetical protein
VTTRQPATRLATIHPCLRKIRAVIDEYTGRMIVGEVTKRATRAWPRISQRCCRHPRRRPLDRDSGRYPDV